MCAYTHHISDCIGVPAVALGMQSMGLSDVSALPSLRESHTLLCEGVVDMTKKSD